MKPRSQPGSIFKAWPRRVWTFPAPTRADTDHSTARQPDFAVRPMFGVCPGVAEDRPPPPEKRLFGFPGLRPSDRISKPEGIQPPVRSAAQFTGLNPARSLAAPGHRSARRFRSGRDKTLHVIPVVGKRKSVCPTSAYKAFISYTHEADGQLAAALESALRRFAVPWYRWRSRRIFRDATGLRITPTLSADIQMAG